MPHTWIHRVRGFSLPDCRNPHSMMALAQCLSSCQDSEATRSEADVLLRQALQQYPEHPHVLMEAANITLDLRGKTAETYRYCVYYQCRKF